MRAYLKALWSYGWLSLFAMGMAIAAQAQSPTESVALETSVLVVYNNQLPASREVAEHYAKRRNIPPHHLLGVRVSTEETISREDFQQQLYLPIFQYLKEQDFFDTRYEIIPATRERPGVVLEHLETSSIRYLVPCYGIPVIIAEDSQLKETGAESVRIELRKNRAAVDHELAWLGRDPKQVLLSGPFENPLYNASRSVDIKPENGVMIVARLDGPTPEIAMGLVDKAMEAEQIGLWGRAYFDTRGLKSGPYLQGDTWIEGAAKWASDAGFETVIDTNESLMEPGYPMSHIALYFGWYAENVHGPFTRTDVPFAPGAIAYHLHSFSGATIRATDKHWVGPLLHAGATATMGCVDEPYLSATPELNVFMEKLLLGFSFGEAAYASQRVLSWQTTVVGDPLYYPFRKPMAWLEMELTEAKSSLLGWLHIQRVNQALSQGTEKPQAIDFLEQNILSQTHPAVCEKLADLYVSVNRLEEAREAYERALLLKPTRDQQNRLLLNLAKMDQQDGNWARALNRMKTLLNKDPSFPQQTMMLKRMKQLALQAGLKQEAAAIESQLAENEK